MDKELSEWEKKANEDFPGLNDDGRFWCAEGWHKLIYEMLGKIWRLGFKTGIGNIKQKYGDLSVCFDGQHVERIIKTAMEDAERTCERCGCSTEGLLPITDTGGWEERLCSKCLETAPAPVVSARVESVAIVLLDNFGDLGDFCWEKLGEETREEWRGQARDVLRAADYEEEEEEEE